MIVGKVLLPDLLLPELLLCFVFIVYRDILRRLDLMQDVLLQRCDNIRREILELILEGLEEEVEICLVLDAL